MLRCELDLHVGCPHAEQPASLARQGVTVTACSEQRVVGDEPVLYTSCHDLHDVHSGSDHWHVASFCTLDAELLLAHLSALNRNIHPAKADTTPVTAYLMGHQTKQAWQITSGSQGFVRCVHLPQWLTQVPGRVIKSMARRLSCAFMVQSPPPPPPPPPSPPPPPPPLSPQLPPPL